MTDTFQIVATDNTTAPPTVTTSTVSISHVGMTELLSWCISIQFPLGVLITAAVGSTPAVYRPATAQDALDYMTNSILTSYEAETRSWLQAQAASAAAAAVSPVV